MSWPTCYYTPRIKTWPCFWKTDLISTTNHQGMLWVSPGRRSKQLSRASLSDCGEAEIPVALFVLLFHLFLFFFNGQVLNCVNVLLSSLAGRSQIFPWIWNCLGFVFPDDAKKGHYCFWIVPHVSRSCSPWSGCHQRLPLACYMTYTIMWCFGSVWGFEWLNQAMVERKAHVI